MKLGVVGVGVIRSGIPACLLCLLNSGCSRSPDLGSADDVRKAIVYAPSGGTVLLEATDKDTIAKLHAPLSAAKRDSGSVEWAAENQLLKISLFMADGSERRILVFRDKRFMLIGEGPEQTYRLDSTEVFDDILDDSK